VLIFAAEGTCLYYEEMGENCYSLLTWRFNGQNHLVLYTASRVLVYPKRPAVTQ
jgi:hypothetical protein